MRKNIAKLGMALALALVTSVANAQSERPVGTLPSPAGDLQMAQTILDAEKYEHAVQSLKAFKSTDNYQRMWGHYLRGIAYFALKQYDAGHKEFLKPYDYVRKSFAPKASQNEFRLAMMSLEKIGWYYRHKKEYLLAFAYHSMEYQLAQGYGSSLEMHAAALSLDVDANFLEDLNLSEMWLQQSIFSAEGIVDSTQKARALGVSFDNLAGTYSSLQRFSEAEQMAKLSMGQWQEFENRTDKSERRVIWARFRLGDVYQSLAISLKGAGEQYAEAKGKAVIEFQIGLKLGAAGGMTEDELKPFTERLVQLAKLSEDTK